MAFLLKDYTDIKEIGRGGMGKVYLATQISLNRKVVIKEMAAGLLTNAIEIRRFENEARAAAALDHDNIIRIYDFGEDRGSFYIAMEYIDGPSLDAVMKENFFIPEIGLMITLHALKGLNYAHENQIIHRDIKPGNILVSKGGAIKVVDFGLAHASQLQIHLTSTDTIMGTPLFMSPEQATGEERKDLRMDIWAVGVLLYRIVTGVYPFAGDNVPSILFNIVQSEPPPLEDAAPALPEDFARAVNSALIKDRTKRLSSLAPLIESLQNYFYELGMRDTVGQIRAYVNDSAASSQQLSKKLYSYHQSRASASTAAGDEARAKLHEQEARRYEAGYLPLGRTIDDLKKNTSSSIYQKSTAMESVFGIWKPLSRRLIGRIVLVSIVILALFAGAGLFLFLQKSRIRSEDLRSATSGARADLQAEKKQSAIPDSSVQKRAKKADTPAVSRKKAAEAKSPTARAAGKAPAAQSAYASSPPWPAATSGRETGKLKMAITPASAEVIIDGEKMTAREKAEGKELQPGKHQITALAPGYDTYAKTVTLEKNTLQIVSADLKPFEKGTGSIHIHSYPWAEIYVDGVFQGNSPTPKPLQLSEGIHTVKLKRKGYKTHEETITVSKSELKRIKVQLVSE